MFSNIHRKLTFINIAYLIHLSNYFKLVEVVWDSEVGLCLPHNSIIVIIQISNLFLQFTYSLNNLSSVTNIFIYIIFNLPLLHHLPHSLGQMFKLNIKQDFLLKSQLVSINWNKILHMMTMRTVSEKWHFLHISHLHCNWKKSGQKA